MPKSADVLRICNKACDLILEKEKSESERYDQCFAYLTELRRSGVINFADFQTCWREACAKADEARIEGVIKNA